ncbi:MAG TPA: hypothetical protein VLJ17_22215 [Xanthobacteraceae bacterium]|nr:hypothetical protein [Xanthobacteraceae bacterium]
MHSKVFGGTSVLPLNLGCGHLVSDADDGVMPSMTEHTGASAQSLTGIWQGTYTYPLGLGSVSFVATLIEAGNSLTGTTHEQGGVDCGLNATLYASLSGSRRGTAVVFVKTYDGSNPNYRTVEYKGTLSDDETEIEGHWIISSMWSGKFVMIRPARKAESVFSKVCIARRANAGDQAVDSQNVPADHCP